MVKGSFVDGSKFMPSPAGSAGVTILLDCPVLAADLTLGAIIAMGDLPVDCELEDAVHAASDIDTGTPAVAMSFGVINAAGNDLDVVLETAIQVGRAGTAARAVLTPAWLTTRSGSAAPKRLGYKVTTIPATAAAGTIYTSLRYRANS